MMIRMVGGWVFLLVPAHPGSPGQRAIKRSLLLLQLWNMSVVETVPVSFWNGDVCYKLYLPFHQKSSGWSETMRSMGDFQWLASVLWIACSALILLIRAGSVSIFQFWFDSVWFQSQVLGFCIRTPAQCKSIVVCENTKMELINFHKKFQSKYIDRPCRVWRSFWWKVLHTWRGWSMCRSVTAVSPSITAHPIDMLFGLRTLVGPRNCVVIFGFSIRTSPQCRSVRVVCENTKTGSMYLDGKFPLKYVHRPRQVWRSYSSHSVWSAPSYSVWSVCVDLSQLGRV